MTEIEVHSTVAPGSAVSVFDDNRQITHSVFVTADLVEKICAYVQLYTKPRAKTSRQRLSAVTVPDVSSGAGISWRALRREPYVKCG